MQHNYDNDDPAKRFEFREEYWEQALALIEADEVQRRKKRRWLLWWIFAGLLLIGSGVGWWGITSGDKTATTQDSSSPANTMNLNMTQKNNPDATGTPEYHKNLGASGEGNTTQTKGQDKGVSTQNIEKQALTANNTPFATNQKQGKGPFTENHSDPKTNNKGAVADAHEGRRNKSLDTPISTLPAENQPQSDVVSSQKTDAADQPNAILHNQNVPELEKALPNDLLQEVIPLPLPFDTVCSNTLPRKNTPVRVHEPLPNQIKPVHDKRFAFGIEASCAAYKPAPDRRWLGGSGGLWGTMRLSKNWSTSLGVSMRYQPGSWLDTTALDPDQSFLFGFGYESIVSERDPVGLLSLEIPIAATWHHRAFSVEAGVAPGRLLYALERFKQTQQTSLKPLSTLKNRLERGDVSPYNKFYANTFAGIEWRFLPNTSLFLHGNYRIGPLVKASVEDPAIKGGSNIALGIRMKLF